MMDIDNIFNTRLNDLLFNFLFSYNNSTQITSVNIQGSVTKSCSVEDYESWTAGDKCINGEISAYLSKKDKSECIHPSYYDEIFKNTKKRCPCTDADFECDIGFIRKGGECISIDPNYYSAPLFCVGYYKLYNGVKKASGNNCKITEAHKDFSITSLVCPNYLDPRSYSWFSLFIMLLIIVTILYYLVRKCLAPRAPEPVKDSKVYEPVTVNKVDEVTY
jgi:hypothetical protein